MAITSEKTENDLRWGYAKWLPVAVITVSFFTVAVIATIAGRVFRLILFPAELALGGTKCLKNIGINLGKIVISPIILAIAPIAYLILPIIGLINPGTADRLIDNCLKFTFDDVIPDDHNI